MASQIMTARQLSGRFRVGLVYPDQTIWRPWRANTIMYDYATILANLLTSGTSSYRISGMYLEFNNTGAPVSPPSYTRADGIDYYNNLDGLTTDYLRLPVIAGTIESTDETYFPQGNKANFFAQTAATMTQGVHGLAFSDVANSIVYGGALVAIVDQADRTRDLVFSRFYLDSGDQPVKPPTAQIGLQWSIEME